MEFQNTLTLNARANPQLNAVGRGENRDLRQLKLKLTREGVGIEELVINKEGSRKDKQ